MAMGALLVRFGMWVPPALAVSTLPAFFAVLRYSLELILTMTVTAGDGR